MEKDNNKEEEKEIEKALSEEALAKIENHLTSAELSALASFFAKEMKKGNDLPPKDE